MLLTKYHHMGVAVHDIEKAIGVHQDIFRCRVESGPFDDPLQGVSVCFLTIEAQHELLLELVAPLGDKSPVAAHLRRGIGIYHMCYQVENIEQTLIALREKKCRVISGPTPAVAFSGRRIAWVHTPSQELIEVLEE